MCYAGLSAADLVSLEHVSCRLRSLVASDGLCWRDCVHARWGKMCASRDLLQATARHATSWKLLYAEKAATHKRYAPWLMACDSEVRAMVDVILRVEVRGGGGRGVVDDDDAGGGGLGIMSCNSMNNINKGVVVGGIVQEEHRDLFNVWTGRSVVPPQSSSLSSLMSSSSTLTSSSSASSSAIRGQEGHSPPRHLWTTTMPGSSSGFSASTSTSTLPSPSTSTTSSPRSIMYCDPTTGTSATASVKGLLAGDGGRKRERRRKTSVVLLFDASSSVTDEDFKTMKAFTKRLIAGLCPTTSNISSGEGKKNEGEEEEKEKERKCGGKIGLIQFNQHPRVELQLTQSNKLKVTRAVESMTQLMGSTDIAAPIRRAREMLNEVNDDDDGDADSDDDDDDDGIMTNGEYYTSRGVVGMPRTGMNNNNNIHHQQYGYHRFGAGGAHHYSSINNNNNGSANGKRRKKNKSRKIIVLMTDGQTHADELRESERETQRAVDDLDATMYTVGVGRDIDEKGLTRIAKVSRLGAYFTLRRFVHSK